MAAGTLYTYPQSFRANKVLIAAKYSSADVKVDGSFKLGETNTSAAFLKKFPNGKVPAFEGKDGFCLSESNAIAYYVSNSALHGEDAKSAALVQQWINFSDNEILPAACTWVFPCLGIIQFNKQDTERAKEQIKKVLKVLDGHLLTKTFMVGERVTLADISIVCNLQSLYEQVLEPEFRKPYQNVNRWFTTMINQPEVKSVLKEVKLCTKMAVFDAKKYKELHGGGGDDKKKDKKPAKKEEPKKEKPKPQPKEQDVPPPPKKEWVDPFTLLPKGTMNLDEFKRTYSNKDILTVALPYFWENLDKDCYSIWMGEYHEDLPKLSFMVSNLVSGMFQRLDKMRKNSFGSVVVLKKPDGGHAIQGIWFWKSQDLAFELCEDWSIDHDSYTWTKLDVNDDKTKELVKVFWSCDEDDEWNKMTVVERKVFK